MKDINASGKEKIVKIPIIKIPFIEGNLSHSLNLIVIGLIIKKMVNFKLSKKINKLKKNSIVLNSDILI